MAKVAASAVERGKLEQKRKKILTCVRKLAPFASQGSALPSEFGGSERLRRKEFEVFKMYYLIVVIKRKRQTTSRPRLSGKVAASAVGRGKCEQIRKKK